MLGLLEEWIGPKGRRFLPLIGTLGVFILLGNYMGLIPGLMAPTSSINVTLGCALTTWVYYHYQGIKAQGVISVHQALRAPPGAPVVIGATHVRRSRSSATRRASCRCRCGCSATSSAKSSSS